MEEFYCIFCAEIVTSRQEALLCGGCDRWQHRRCHTGVDRATYRQAVIITISTIFTPKDWSVFKQPIRTNNDIEGWHNALNRRAGGQCRLQFYLLIELLHREARLTSITIKLVSDKKLKRIQRRKYRQLQQKLFDAWEQYQTGNKSAS